MRTGYRLQLLASIAAVTVTLGAGSAYAASDESPPSFDRAGAADAVTNQAAANARVPSKTAIRLKGLKNGDLTVGNKVTVAGTLRPYVKGQKVTVLLKRGKKTIERKKLNVRRKGKRGKVGKFSFSDRLIKPGRYGAEAVHDKNASLGGSKDSSRRFHISYPDLGQGSSGDAVKIFNKLLADLGYVNDENHSYNSATGRAVLAFRKVNGMARKESASAGIFKRLAKGKGGFKLKHPGAGKHVETDLSRQVMVLAKDGEVDEIYTISSGAPATPTILGKYSFYRKEPGTNSHGMVNSVYFIRGYATHGYASVPTYPASHGCLRNPIPDSLHIYNWIDIGDSIYVYR